MMIFNLVRRNLVKYALVAPLFLLLTAVGASPKMPYLLVATPQYSVLTDTTPKKQNRQKEKPVFTIVEQNPEFPGGQGELFKWLSMNIQYPQVARENNVQGTVYVGYVVDVDGSIIDVSVKRGLGGGCSEEAVRVVSAMPKWKPGKTQGRFVRVAYTLPIKFRLEDDVKTDSTKLVQRVLPHTARAGVA